MISILISILIYCEKNKVRGWDLVFIRLHVGCLRILFSIYWWILDRRQAILPMPLALAQHVLWILRLSSDSLNFYTMHSNAWKFPLNISPFFAGYGKLNKIEKENIMHCNSNLYDLLLIIFIPLRCSVKAGIRHFYSTIM